MKSKPFTNPADYGRMLATVDEQTLLAMVAAESKVLNVDRMRVMVEEGLLNAAPATAQQTDPTVDWVNRISAFTSFTYGITTEVLTADARFGSLYREAETAVFGATEDARSMFAAAVATVIEEHARLLKEDLIDEYSALAHSGMARMLAGAVAMDMPDQVRAIAIACPDAMTTMFGLQRLGAAMQQQVLPRAGEVPEVRVNAYFSALQLSRETCLSELFACGLRADTAVAEARYESFSEVAAVLGMASIVVPVCTPSAFALVLDAIVQLREFQLAGKKRQLVEFAQLAAGAAPSTEGEPAVAPWLRNYVPAFAHVGAYDDAALDAVQAALRDGHVSVVMRLADAAYWAQVGWLFSTAQSPILHAVATGDPADAHRIEDAILALLAKAAECGEAATAEATFVAPDVRNALALEPIRAFADKNYHRLITHYIARGLDVHAEPQPGVKSPLAVALKNAPASADVMRSSSLRGRALDILNSAN
ncbi:hypothetical protein ACSFA0_25210 [Variovorax sp. LT1P1]|uniref:hypothetical protein n=1 Tax=Variovorax sp. LT1P1 TaxID=3443730 RepID=UPI003F467DD3